MLHNTRWWWFGPHLLYLICLSQFYAYFYRAEIHSFPLMEFESNHLSWMKLVSSTYCWGIYFSNQNVWSILCACQKNPKILAAWVLANVSRRSVLKTFRFYPVLQMLLHTVKSCDKYFSVNIKYLKNKRMAVLSLVIRWLSATSVCIIMYGTQSKTQSPVSGFYSQIICEMVVSKKKKKKIQGAISWAYCMQLWLITCSG